MRAARSVNRARRRGRSTQLGAIAVAVLLALTLTLSLGGVAEAHEPIFPDASHHAPAQALRITDMSISWAFYAHLSPGHVADYYRFTARRGQAFYAQIIIPQITRYKQFAPVLALIGPGLPHASLPVALPAGSGALVYAATPAERLHPARFHEVFSNTSYWIRQTVTRSLPATGTYYIAVFDTTTRGGKYCLAVGQGEQVSPGDLFDIPALLQRLHEWFS